MPSSRRTLVVGLLVAAALLHAAAFLLPDHWWVGAVSRDVRLPPEPGSVQRRFLLPQIVSIFDRGDTPPLDLAGRPAEVLALAAFGLVLLRRHRLAAAAAALAAGAWGTRYWLCGQHGFLAGYWAWLGGMGALAVAAVLGRRPLGRGGRLWGRAAWGLAGVAVAGLVGWQIVFDGPSDLSIYPPREASPYRLPFPAGTSRQCVQGNHGRFSHFGRQEFSYDFVMPVGSDVIAARGGTVTEVRVSRDGHGRFDSTIMIDHGDGTVGKYLHLMKGGSYVTVGQHVRQGQLIGASGDVGYSAGPHLHFHVLGPGRAATIPVTFADVETDLGVPRTFRWYTSGNRMASNQE